jgi:hypothetical protein
MRTRIGVSAIVDCKLLHIGKGSREVRKEEKYCIPQSSKPRAVQAGFCPMSDPKHDLGGRLVPTIEIL